MNRLHISLANKYEMKWAEGTSILRHYLQQKVHPRARPHGYVVKFRDNRIGMIIVANPHATKCGGWWRSGTARDSEDELHLPTKWQVVDLCRIWLSPLVQKGGCWSGPDYAPGFTDRKGEWQPTVASWAISSVLDRVQEDRISFWPPVYPEQPYHIRLVISYHDPIYHSGTIYKVSGAEPMYTDEDGQPRPGPSGKYGWCWRLPEPDWEYQDIYIRRPRTLRLPLEFAS